MCLLFCLNASIESMSQGYAIELYFDPALENQVLKAWNVLARRQISTQLIEIESRPHLTLFTSPFVDIAKLENVLRNFAAKQEPLAVSFSSIGSFPSDSNVLFLGPTPSLSLLQFHSQLCDAMKKEGVEVGDEQRPDTWIPYCSVAEEVPKTRMAEAFTVLRDLKMPVSGYAMEMSLVEYSPVRELFSFTLGMHHISEI
ncbi:RNA ligase/cyclic nucleotide phosphodiesterase family protein [Perilla frutescens var. hirtella]|uniref:RNA ligase/cyclic nucleotide phosphodiesterase family protein n=1 Tax=Perilla frutescens var. hirtella TaxID=608512 RepID=A0AAD4P7W1_PERFH|nr:RNA ligase/cyclic nucleotide phosphodiesterase family protein [Perilla frutescens var. hirtella]